MDINLERLEILVSHQPHNIEKAVSDAGYLPKTVMGVGTLLLENQGDVDLLTAKHQVTLERFLRPLLEVSADG